MKNQIVEAQFFYAGFHHGDFRFQISDLKSNLNFPHKIANRKSKIENALNLVAVCQSFVHRHFVHEFQIRADRHSHRDSRDADA